MNCEIASFQHNSQEHYWKHTSTHNITDVNGFVHDTTSEKWWGGDKTTPIHLNFRIVIVNKGSRKKVIYLVARPYPPFSGHATEKKNFTKYTLKIGLPEYAFAQLIVICKV